MRRYGRLTRLVLAATLALATGMQALAVRAEEPEWRHGTALTGDPKYPADFKHFDYANPQAPKGGTVRLAESLGFDTFNPILPKGNVAPGLGLLYDTLMESSLD